MAREEVATLLDNGQARQPRDDGRGSRRVQLVRVAVGIVSAFALVAGSVLAVEMIADEKHAHAVPTSSLSTAPASMEADFGWGTWCSVRASAGCIFSSDKDTCKKQVMEKCDPDEYPPDGPGGDGSGSGSGSGSHHGAPEVGDPERNTTHHKKHKKKHKKGKTTEQPDATTAPPTLL